MNMDKEELLDLWILLLKHLKREKKVMEEIEKDLIKYGKKYGFKSIKK